MRRGFTLIEMMSTWLVIVLLAGILFPVFARATEKARQSNCLQNLCSIGAALRLYAADHHGRFPPDDNYLAPLLRVAPEHAVLVCPSQVATRTAVPPFPSVEELAAAGVTGYVYRSGLYDDDHSDEVVAADDLADRHSDGANYLWVGGNSKWMRARAIAEMAEREGPTSGMWRIRELQVMKTGPVDAPVSPPGDDLDR